MADSGIHDNLTFLLAALISTVNFATTCAMSAHTVAHFLENVHRFGRESRCRIIVMYAGLSVWFVLTVRPQDMTASRRGVNQRKMACKQIDTNANTQSTFGSSTIFFF